MIKEYKSNTFSLLIQEPKYALQVFNALNGTNYEDESEIQIDMLESGVQLTVRNDASFLLDGYLSLYEHQSTTCPNMPLRGLFYISRLLEEYTSDYDLYGKNLVHIPNVQFVVLYNGKEEQPERKLLKLSDAYLSKKIKSDLELTCVVYNINGINNPNLTADCDAIRGYMSFVGKVREIYSGKDKELIRAAVSKAIDYCIDNGILKEFYQKNRVLIEENEMLNFTHERRIELATRDAKAEGLEEGREEGATLLSSAILGLRAGKSEDELLEIAGMTKEFINSAKQLL